MRSGLLALYVALSLLAVRYILTSRRYLLGLGILAVLVAMPLLAYQYVPSFRAKVDYMRWGLIKFQVLKRDGGELNILGATTTNRALLNNGFFPPKACA